MPGPNDRYDIAGIQFADEGISINYMRVPDDVRLDGALFAQHTMSIAAAHPNFIDEVDELRTLVTKILEEAIEDFEQTAPVEPGDVDDDDERGMGE